jgi:hypothetical protein
MPYAVARLFRGGLFGNCAERDPKHEGLLKRRGFAPAISEHRHVSLIRVPEEGAPHLRVLSEDGDLDFETDVRAKN